jgi:Cytidylate kinase-like family/BON domain
MSGGQSLARCLADQLGARCVSREDLVALLDAHGEHAKKILATLDRATRAYDQFSQLRRPYLILMRVGLLEFIREGNVIYHGHAGHILVGGLPCCLRVRVNAPMSLRTRNAVERLGLSEDEAKEAVLQEDAERLRWARFMYGRDIRDPALYDITFSLDRLPLGAICTMIVAGLGDAAFQPTDEARTTIENVYLATRVEAALVTHPDTRALEIGAQARDGHVLLQGPYQEPVGLERVVRVAAGVPGVVDVEYEPGCPSSFEFGT